MVLSPTFCMRRFFALLLIVFVLPGCSCDNKEPFDESALGPGFAGPTLDVPMPTAEILAALGPENNIPIQRLLPDPFLAIVGKPKQFLNLPISAGGEWLVANTIVRSLQLYGIEPNNIELIVQTTGFPMTVMVNVPNPQNPMAMPQPRLIPISRRAMVITFHTAVEKQLLFESILGFEPDANFLEAQKRIEGKSEYYDLTPQNLGIPQRLALGMIDERTVVIAEGVEDDIKAVFSEALPKNAVIDRIKRAPVDSNDLTVLTSLEGLNVSAEMLEQLLAPMSESGYISAGIVQAVTQHLRTVSLSLNGGAAMGQPVASIYAEGRDAEGAEIIRKAIRGVVTNGQATLIAMNESAKQLLPIPPDFALALLNAISVEVDETRINVVLKNFETLIPTVNGWIKDQQAVIEKEMLEQQRVEQLKMLAEFSVAYYTENGKFPADILDTEGKPLLSWRVALLPTLGQDEFYKQFKLDEPWNSETNLKLMETIPFIFHPLALDVALPKTVIRFFDSPSTPLANKELKIEDLKSPQTTLMFVVVTPEHAVEWTKPESLEFNADKIADTVGEMLLGVSFVGQPWRVPILPESDPLYEKRKQDIAALITGTPLDPQESAVPQLPPEQ